VVGLEGLVLFVYRARAGVWCVLRVLYCLFTVFSMAVSFFWLLGSRAGMLRSGDQHGLETVLLVSISVSVSQ